jgi:hypothetical protein
VGRACSTDQIEEDTFSIFVRKPEGRIGLGRPSTRREYIIKMKL